MNAVQVYSFTITGSTTTKTTQIYVGNTEQIILNIPKVAGVFGSAVVAVSLLGAATSGAAGVQMNYWDYGSATPKSCVVTVSTTGMYELPNAGGAPYIQIQFDTPVTVPTNGINLLTPKTTF